MKKFTEQAEQWDKVLWFKRITWCELLSKSKFLFSYTEKV